MYDPSWQPRRRARQSAGAWVAAAVALAFLLALVVGVALALPELTRPDPIGGAGTASATPSSLRPSPSFVRPTPTPAPTFRTYVVRPGDTLTSIARRFKTTARSIAFWNRSTYRSLNPESRNYDPNRIQVGWTLVLIPGQVYDEGEEPSPPPSPSPSVVPSPSAGPSPTPIASGPSTVVSHGPRDSGAVALTFDMGGRLDPAVAIMDWLIGNEVKATIFPTGEIGTQTAAGLEVLARVRDHPELFELANHSWDHPDFTKLRGSQIRSQLTRTEQALGAVVGRTSRPWFRPPFGAWDDDVRQAVGAAGWEYTVMWDIDTIDWRPPSDGGPTAADIEAKVVSQSQGGSIVLMHLGGYRTLDALPGILAGLEEKGLRPVTLSEMFRR
jgi:peptidoglycan/xylan/chitin deacetylase (PgdA/CDA1 family)